MLPQYFLKGQVRLQSDHRESQDARTSEQTHRINTGEQLINNQYRGVQMHLSVTQCPAEASGICQGPDSDSARPGSSRGSQDPTGSRTCCSFVWLQLKLTSVPSVPRLRLNVCKLYKFHRNSGKPGINHKRSSELQHKPSEEGSLVSQSSHKNSGGKSLSY